MQRIDDAFVLIGACYGAAGMAFGTWMGATHNLQFANSHAHVNLVGFVSFMLFGIVYRLWPALKERRLAAAHFVLANLGAAMLLTGKVLVDATGEASLLLPVGALTAVLGMLIFVANLVVGLSGRAPAGRLAPAE